MAPAPSYSPVASAIAEENGQRLRVMVVDDDPVAARLMASQLMNAGTDATWGSLTWSQLEEEVRLLRPQLVLLDLQLGAELPDGVELGIALRRAFPTLLVGVCTGSEDPCNSARALSARLRFYLTKRWLLAAAIKDVGALLSMLVDGALVYMVDPWPKEG